MSKQEVKKQETKVKPLARFESTLTNLITQGINAIPSDVNTDRLRLNALMAISQDYKLSQLAQENPGQVAQIVYNFVTLGLDMHQKEAYIIPFGQTPTVIIDYKGEMKLAKNYSVEPIREIYSRVVYEEDEYYFDDEDKFFHKFDPFSLDRGERVGAFCTVLYENGVQQTEFVNTEEIDKVRGVSKTASRADSVWNKWTDSMWKKTVIKKAMKNVSLDFGNSVRQEAYQESDTDIEFNNERKNNDEVINQDEVIDVEVAEEVEV